MVSMFPQRHGGLAMPLAQKPPRQVRAESSGLARTLGSAYALHEGDLVGGMWDEHLMQCFGRPDASKGFFLRAQSQVAQLHAENH